MSDSTFCSVCPKSKCEHQNTGKVGRHFELGQLTQEQIDFFSNNQSQTGITANNTMLKKPWQQNYEEAVANGMFTPPHEPNTDLVECCDNCKGVNGNHYANCGVMDDVDFPDDDIPELVPGSSFQDPYNLASSNVIENYKKYSEKPSRIHINNNFKAVEIKPESSQNPSSEHNTNPPFFFFNQNNPANSNAAENTEPDLVEELPEIVVVNDVLSLSNSEDSIPEEAESSHPSFKPSFKSKVAGGQKKHPKNDEDSFEDGDVLDESAILDTELNNTDIDPNGIVHDMYTLLDDTTKSMLTQCQYCQKFYTPTMTTNEYDQSGGTVCYHCVYMINYDSNSRMNFDGVFGKTIFDFVLECKNTHSQTDCTHANECFICDHLNGNKIDNIHGSDELFSIAIATENNNKKDIEEFVIEIDI